MADYKWCQNTSWNPDIEAEFEKRLALSRNKAHYLRVQASMLSSSEPAVALRLIGRYFEFGEQIELATAYADKAAAHLAMGDVGAAIAALEAALAREATHPFIRTRACFDLPEIIAIERITELYPRALNLLDAAESEQTFAADRYVWNGSRALILAEMGQVSEAASYASAALAAASETRSGFARHPNVGLVASTDDRFGNRLKMLAARQARGSLAQDRRQWWRFWN